MSRFFLSSSAKDGGIADDAARRTITRTDVVCAAAYRRLVCLPQPLASVCVSLSAHVRLQRCTILQTPHRQQSQVRYSSLRCFARRQNKFHIVVCCVRVAVSVASQRNLAALIGAFGIQLQPLMAHSTATDAKVQCVVVVFFVINSVASKRSQLACTATRR